MSSGGTPRSTPTAQSSMRVHADCAFEKRPMKDENTYERLLHALIRRGRPSLDYMFYLRLERKANANHPEGLRALIITPQTEPDFMRLYFPTKTHISIVWVNS
jgi:hypothetical protein